MFLKGAVIILSQFLSKTHTEYCENIFTGTCIISELPYTCSRAYVPKTYKMWRVFAVIFLLAHNSSLTRHG